MDPITTGPRSAKPRRVSDLDLLRGFVLCVIFINHIPGTIFESLTPKNFGFSDSAEAFVFLSGVSLTLAYGARFAEGRAWDVVQSLKRRAVKLYGLHILLSLAAIAIYAAGANIGEDDALMSVHGRDLFIEDPWAALVGLVTLGHQLGYFNILPLYVVLIAFLVAQLALARLGIGAMLAVSAWLYAMARLFGWNIPTWPMKGAWFFDPLAWQLLMALGAASATLYRRGALLRVPSLTFASTGIVLVSAVVTTDGLGAWPGLRDAARATLDLGKTELGIGRLVHFLAVAYLVYGVDFAFVSQCTPVGGCLRLLGRNSLAIFATLSLLAAIGQVATTLGGHAVLLDCLIVGGGLALLLGVARLLETRDASFVAVRPGLGARQR